LPPHAARARPTKSSAGARRRATTRRR
jgi:hypothetical protein